MNQSSSLLYQRSASRLFRMMLFLGVAFSSVAMFFSLKIFPAAGLVIDSLRNKLEAICGCTEHFNFIHHPLLFTTLLVLSGSTLVAFSIGLIKIITLQVATRRFIRSQQVRIRTANPLIDKLAKKTKLEGRIAEISSEKPLVFCYGLAKPMIFVSSATADNFSEDELEAILLHEKHHLIFRAPLKLFLAKTMRYLLFFIPGTRALAKEFSKITEVAADEYAINLIESIDSFRRAFGKMLRFCQNSRQDNYHIARFATENTDRIASEAFTKPARTIRSFSIALLSVIALAFVSSTTTASFSNSVHSGHNSGICDIHSPTQKAYTPADAASDGACSMDEFVINAHSSFSCPNHL